MEVKMPKTNLQNATPAPTKKTRATQTTRINGKRVVLTTNNGKLTVTAAPELEWVLQAAGVRALRAMPEYAATVSAVKPGTFTLAGDFNSARRGRQESMKAKATGLTPGEHDLRLYLSGGRMGLIEYKAAKTPVSGEQRKRHALLAALGFTRQAVLRVASEAEAASMAVATVRGWLAANDNQPQNPVAFCG
jgi:hypothetical protein